jgi:hypothetical protein
MRKATPQRKPHCSQCRKSKDGCPYESHEVWEYWVRAVMVTHHSPASEDRRYSSVSLICNRCGHTWESTARSAFVLAGFEGLADRKEVCDE